MKHSIPLFFLATSGAISASQDACAPTHPHCYEPGYSECSYCLGPAKSLANAPVRPYTCNGDWEITVAGFYWKPLMDGLEFAVRDSVRREQPRGEIATRPTNNLIVAQFESPHPQWDFGFKLGIDYNTTCDNWDIGALWTTFHGNAFAHEESNLESNQSLAILWSAYTPLSLNDTATDIQANWELDLNLIDLALGREYWASPRFSMRPHMGLRIAFVDQNYEIGHRGINVGASNLRFKNQVNMDLDFHGAGIRAGLDAAWHLGCGYSIFGAASPSIVYGKFKLNHKENNLSAIPLSNPPFLKDPVLSTRNSSRVSRAMFDFELGIHWFSLICDCKYGLGASFAFEQHLFYHFNQFWRVKRIDETADNTPPNLTGENVHHQRRGTLSISGWTLSIQFDF